MRQFENKEEMAKIVKETIERSNDDKTMMNGMLDGKLVDCDPETGKILIAYETKHWENNRAGFLHGGVMGAMLDLAMGDLSICYSDALWTPTITLEVKYVRPTKIGDTVLVEAEMQSNGKRINQLRATAVSKHTGKLLGSATGTYFAIDTRVEHGESLK